jgi:hypothetical protein
MGNNGIILPLFYTFSPNSSSLTKLRVLGLRLIVLYGPISSSAYVEASLLGFLFRLNDGQWETITADVVFS